MLDLSLLKQYFTGNKRRASYKDAKKQFDILRQHCNGEFPGDLISERRPSETEEIFQYRKQIYQPVTMEPLSSIIRSLGKIRRSSDWSIKYPNENKPAVIADDETLETYCEYDFPNFTSISNWAFSILLKNILIDPNAILLVAPLKTDVESHEYLRPYPTIYNSDNAYEYIEGELAILLSTEQTDNQGKIFIVVDGVEQTISRWEQKGQTADYTMTDEYVYPTKDFPAYRLPGIFVKQYGSKDVLTYSQIQPIVPRLNEAAREYSDMQAEVVQNIYSLMWEYASQKCEECLDPATGVSTGKIKVGNGKKLITCTKCNGTGQMGGSPYKKIVLRQPRIDEQATPMPPAGYIQKQIDIVKLQDSRIDAHIYKALSAINMQFLAQTPLNNSGYAKEVDRDELNNFVYGIAEDIVKVLDQLYKLINEYRYAAIVPQGSVRDDQLPVIPVPEKFDLLSSATLLEELTSVRTSQATPIIIQAHEIDYCAKKFQAQPAVKNELVAVMTLDPLPAANDDEKFVRLNGGGITKIAYVISCNILPFVRRAVFEDENFYQQPYDKQVAKMQEYATALMASIAADEAEKMKEQATAMTAAVAAKPPAVPEAN